MAYGTLFSGAWLGTLDRALGRLAPHVLGVLLALSIPAAHAHGVSATDDRGRTITLPTPARRIVSLAPSGTADLFAIGAGRQIVGTVSGTQYPPAARELLKVGDAAGLDLERILALRPDLVVAWLSGNGAARIAQLRRLGLRVYVTEPTRLSDVARTLANLGRLSGHAAQGRHVAARFRLRESRLARRYQHRRALRVFYEIWDQPLMTVGGTQWISQVVRLCGGRNVFGHLDSKTATVDREAVLAARPQIIVADAPNKNAADRWLSAWKTWPSLPAVRRRGLLAAPLDTLSEPTPRLLDGAKWLCGQMQNARGRMEASHRKKAGDSQ